tara:strand:+ start:84 stop:1226 length:1143 start_codon:yes stop_codon:yes gene_type:complete
MKVLINSTTAFIGGGVQVGVSFAKYIFNNDPGFDFIFAISKPIYDNLPDYIRDNDKIRVFEVSPSKIFKGRSERKRIREIENYFKPDFIYSLAFPSYVSFKTKEIGRYTNPWEIFKAETAWSLLSRKEKILRSLKNTYRLYWARRAEFYETQTISAKHAISKKFDCNEEKILVSPNVLNPLFENIQNVDYKKNNLTKKNKVKLFCLSADHKHKNLKIIPKVIKQIKKIGTDKKFQFILTLPQKSDTLREILEESKKDNNHKYIRNVGPLSLSDCVDWYTKIDLVFLPTVLEVFSATYLEAMKFKKVIITSDMDFSRETCGDAAIYFKANDYIDAAQKIIRAMLDQNFSNKVVKNIDNQIKKFPGFEQKHQEIVNWILKLK